MLRELSVQNMATIEDARVELHPGFCVWTGETGAGKSLLLSALGLVLGEKASSELVRAGKEEARAAAVFELAAGRLRNDVEAVLGMALDDDSLIITRRISRAGRSQAYVNDMPVTIGVLKQLGSRLIDMHGQHESRGLLDPDRQRALLDAYGGLEPALARYQEARFEFDALRRTRAALHESAQTRLRERDLLAFEREELNAAAPVAGEFDDLMREAHRLSHVEELREATAEGYRELYEADGSIQERLELLARRLAPLAEAQPELTPLAGDLERIAEETRDLARQLNRINSQCDEHPARLEEVETRLALYRRLASRFRCEADELVAKQAAVEAQLNALQQANDELAKIAGPLNAAWQRLTQACEALSAGRKSIAKSFAKAVQAQLKHLSLGNARISVEIATSALPATPGDATPSEHGVDEVEIVFAPNPGEPPRSLRKIASGGELSRVTLAVKTVLAEVDRISTIVLDEIDTGVGGRLGAVLGRMLAALAREHQVLCVTHLPQLASHATNHWVIRKQVEGRRTVTTIRKLDDAERVTELAAMMRGDAAADSTRQEAQAMLAEARGSR